MIRPFGLQDLLLMRSLQRRSAILAIEHVLTHPHDPVWVALTSPWPWAGFGVATYVLNERHQGTRLIGFVQLMKRAARPEADILHLAPALPAGAINNLTATLAWQRLLDHCFMSAAGHGLQRIFASIPDGGPEETCLKDVGFSLYTRETIFRLAALPPVSSVPAGFRPQGPQDSWALQRLYTRGTPKLVQQAEGAVTGDVGSPPLSWWEPDSWQGVVWEPAGEVRGAVGVHRGRAGHWLRLWGVNTLSAREARSLVEQGLRLLSLTQPRGSSRSLPVYATVRDYEIGLSGTLTGFGFAPYTDRARFVKHTMASIREPAAVSAVPSLEVAPKAAARIQREPQRSKNGATT